MQKISAPLGEEGYAQNASRLQTISETTLGSLTDEIVLELLAERRSLAKENSLFESVRDEETKRAAALSEEEHALERELEELNTSITPDKDDDTLLSLIQHRKELETKLESLNLEEAKLSGRAVSAESHPQEESPENVVSNDDLSLSQNAQRIGDHNNETEPKEISPEKEESVMIPIPDEASIDATPPQQENVVMEEPAEVEPPKKVLDSQIGSEGIKGVSSQESKDYLQFLQASPEEALSQLETLPESLRKDKIFMLEVAKVDPAYAMHYADAKTLKKDEDFNVRIAGMKNPRDSGNPLAEMLSEMRTNQVVMAAVKQDFRNLRYATRSMEGYEEMIGIAKREAREKVRSLGQAVDIRVFLPKTLREDKEFLKEIEEIVEKLKEKKP